jgi:hypothetical protein
MEDFWGILIVIGVILYKTVTSVKKVKREIAEMPDEDSGEVIVPIDEEQAAPVVVRVSQPKRKKEHRQKHQPVVAETVNVKTPEPPLQEQKEESTAMETDIEDVRRGIIWSEILNRKY